MSPAARIDFGTIIVEAAKISAPIIPKFAGAGSS
jgi:hypothetical protein